MRMLAILALNHPARDNLLIVCTYTVSLAWPDLLGAGAYRLDIISALVRYGHARLVYGMQISNDYTTYVNSN